MFMSVHKMDLRNILYCIFIFIYFIGKEVFFEQVHWIFLSYTVSPHLFFPITFGKTTADKYIGLCDAWVIDAIYSTVL